MTSIAGLHAHNEYSLLDGAGTARQHAEAARNAGYIALAETNHGTLAGSLHHMVACREAGIMPISGVEAYYRPNRKVQGQKEWLRNYHHLTLIAKDLQGWHSLMRIVSESHQTGFYNKPCVDDELLEKHREGIICLTGCIGGRLCQSIIKEDHRQAESWIRQLKRVYRDDLFIEIMPHDFDDGRVANIEAARIANHHSIGLVTTIDSHYPTKKWAPTQDVLLMIATNQNLKKREKKREAGEDVYEFTMSTFYHLTRDKIAVMYAEHHPGLSSALVQRSMDDTLLVASRCQPFLVDKSEKMPVVSFPGKPDNEEYLRELAFQGLERRGYANDQRYIDQVETELAAFVKLNSVEQMLMAWDVVDWAKSDRPVPKRAKDGSLVYEDRKKPIMVGPGRGSAVGSTVSWTIGITNVNPIKHRLLFERFLNPERVGKPDIDIDFGPERVDEVEAYVKVKYKHVVDIIAHSTFGPRAALTDVGRVLCVPYDHVKSATKTIDDQEHGKLDDLRALNPAIERYATDHPDAFEQSKRIQGMVARKSEHAGGILILPGPVANFIPVERTGGQKGKMLSAYGERSGKGNALISDYGYNKLDVLRVAELSKQQLAVDLYEERTGERVDLDALAVHDDPYACEPEVMQVFKDGLLVGVFQFSATAARLTRRVQPDNIFDLASINALIRPGPRGAGIDADFVERKHGRAERTIWHPCLGPYLDYTQNLMVFQEQLIEVVHRLGGLSKAQADIFRKIASKLYRDPEYARATMGEWFVPIRDGFMAAGISEDTFGTPTGGGEKGEKPTGIWGQFLSFSDYSLNLAHADGYSLLAYRGAWLKHHMPREFYAAFLSVGLSQVTKKKILQKIEAVREARHMGLKIMPPDVNTSRRGYTVVEEGIRLGLLAIKGIGPAAATAIEINRPFESMADIERRVPAQALNVTARAALVQSGACDRWSMRDRFTEEWIDECERARLGMSLTSTYSIAAYSDAIEGRFWTEVEFDDEEDGERVCVVGEVAAVKEHVDKRGGVMAFVDLVYGPNNYSCTLFASLYEVYKDLINSRRPLMIMGAKNTHNGRAGIRVEGLPVDDESEWVPPVIDLAEFAALLGDQSEQLVVDSVFPEDMQEGLDVSTMFTTPVEPED